MELLLYTDSVPRGNGQWDSLNTLPHCLCTVGSGTPCMYRLTAFGRRAMEPLLYPPSPLHKHGLL